MSTKLTLLGTSGGMYGFAISDILESSGGFTYRRVISDGAHIYLGAAASDGTYGANFGVLKIDPEAMVLEDSMVLDMGDYRKSSVMELAYYDDKIYVVGRVFSSPNYTPTSGYTFNYVIYALPTTNLNAHTVENVVWSNSYIPLVNSERPFVASSTGKLYLSFDTKIGPVVETQVGFISFNSSAEVIEARTVLPVAGVYSFSGHCNIQPDEERVFVSSYTIDDPIYPTSTRLWAFDTAAYGIQGVLLSISYLGYLSALSLVDSYCDNTNFWGLFFASTDVTREMFILKFQNSYLRPPSKQVRYSGVQPYTMLRAANGDFVVAGVSYQGAGLSIDGSFVMRFDSSLNLVYQRKIVWLEDNPSIFSRPVIFEHRGNLWLLVRGNTNPLTAYVLQLPSGDGSGLGKNKVFSYEEGNYLTGSALLSSSLIEGAEDIPRSFQELPISLDSSVTTASISVIPGA